MHFADVPSSPASTMGAVLGEMMLQENNEVLFRHGLFNGKGVSSAAPLHLHSFPFARSA